MKTGRFVLPVLVVALVVTIVWSAVRGPSGDAPSIPTVRSDDLDAAIGEVDAQLAALWSEDELQPAEFADDLTVLRRLSLALHGTIPSLEEIRRFEADDRPDRLRHWTAAMLEDPRFADYFAERLARMLVGVDEGQFIIFRRDRFTEWLSDQIAAHSPYDEIVREMIAGNGVWTGDAEVNFLTGAYANEEFDEEKLTGRTVRAFLGQRIDCAQCHNHPFDHWKQSEFEGLAAHYGQLRISLVGIEDDAQVLFTLPDTVAPELERCELSDEVRGQFKNDDSLRVNPRIEVINDGKLWVILDAPNEEDDPKPRFVVRRTDAGIQVSRAAGEHVVEDAVWDQIRVVAPNVPFGADWVPENGTRRDKLAAWVTHPDNRRFERAIANRVWGLMFGRHYAFETREYDETQDEWFWKPRNVDDLPDPEHEDTAEQLQVLDILGADFRAHGCDLRRLIQVIAGSEVFRLESRHPVEYALEQSPLDEEELHDVERELELLDRRWAVFPLVRLRPEQVVGAILQAGHVQTIDQNSHLFVRFQRAVGEANFVNEFGDPGENELENRAGTIPQALLRMNGEMVRNQSKTSIINAAGRIEAVSRNPQRCLENCFLVCLSRRPTAEERDFFLPEMEKVGGKYPDGVVQDIFWTLFNSPEFSWNH